MVNFARQKLGAERQMIRVLLRGVVVMVIK